MIQASKPNLEDLRTAITEANAGNDYQLRALLRNAVRSFINELRAAVTQPNVPMVHPAYIHADPIDKLGEKLFELLQE